MRLREARIILVLAMLVGLVTLYFGETGSCACAEQTLGQPAPFNEFQAEVMVGVAAIVASMAGLALSLLYARKGTTQTGADITTT